MTTLRMSGSNIGAAGSVDGFLVKLKRFVAAQHAGYVAYQTTLQELKNLTERDLEDIGFSRGDIEGIARDAAEDARKSV